MDRKVECMHKGCAKLATKIISYEQPNHPEFHGQTHDCCGDH